mgnify:CR=1 FL=1
MLELPTQEQFVRAIRHWEIKQEKICTWLCVGFGVGYVIIGFYYIRLLVYAADYSWRSFVAVFPIGTALFIPLALMCLYYEIARRRCPNCHHKIRSIDLAIALHGCPRCRQTLFFSEKLTRIDMPRRHSMLATGLEVVLCYMAGLLLIGVYMVRASDIYAAMVDGIQYMMFVTGISLMFFPLFKLWSVKFKNPFSPVTLCPVCGENANRIFQNLTGNCSICGSRSVPDWPPAEPEPVSDLPTMMQWLRWFELRHRWGVASLGVIPIIIFVYLLGILSHISADQCMFLAGVILIIWLIIIFGGGITLHRYGQQIHFSFACPYCRMIHSGFRNIEYLARCPRCRRKLVRDGDAGKGAGE